VEPKRQALNAANEQLNSAMEKLNQLKIKIQGLEQALSKLTAEFERATQAKLKCQQEADLTNKTINLANRLVGGLASENVRWADAVAGFKARTAAVSLQSDLFIIVIIYCYTTRVAHDTYMYIHKNIQLRNSEYKSTRIAQ